MDEFLKQNYTFITRSVEIIAAITGLVCYRSYKSTTTKYFIWFLVYVAIVELVGSYPIYVAKYETLIDIQLFLKDTYFEKNYWFLTIFGIFGSALFYALYFREIITNRKYKAIIKYTVFVFVLSFIGYYIFN